MRRMIFSIIVLLCLVAIAEGHGIARDITEGFSFDVEYLISFTPVVYEFNFLGGVGLFHNLDLLVNLTTIKIEDDVVKWKEFWFMPRFDVGGIGPVMYNILGLGLGYSLEPHHSHNGDKHGSKASKHAFPRKVKIHNGDHHHHSHYSDHRSNPLTQGKFIGMLNYFSEIDIVSHLFVTGLESRFNFAPELWLDVGLSPALILESLIGIHLGVLAELHIHTHFDDMHFGAGLGLDLQLDWFRFRIGYDFLHRHLGGEVGVVFLP